VRGERDEVRSVAIRAEAWQIASTAFRALDAMTNTMHEDGKRGRIATRERFSAQGAFSELAKGQQPSCPCRVAATLT
jgi:hypothetical protein